MVKENTDPVLMPLSGRHKQTISAFKNMKEIAECEMGDHSTGVSSTIPYSFLWFLACCLMPVVRY